MRKPSARPLKQDDLPCTSSIRTFTLLARPMILNDGQDALPGGGEPAFWMGYDRSGVNSFYDYYRQLTEWEPKRAAQFGIRHYAWLGLNAKEAENVGFARDVIAVLPEFLEKPNALGVGEIGLHKCTKNEVTTLLALIDRAMKTDEQLLFHTPHLEDKYKGTRMILTFSRPTARGPQPRASITARSIRSARTDGGYWAGSRFTPRRLRPNERPTGGNLRSRADPGQQFR